MPESEPAGSSEPAEATADEDWPRSDHSPDHEGQQEGSDASQGALHCCAAPRRPSHAGCKCTSRTGSAAPTLRWLVTERALPAEEGSEPGSALADSDPEYAGAAAGVGRATEQQADSEEEAADEEAEQQIFAADADPEKFLQASPARGGLASAASRRAEPVAHGAQGMEQQNTGAVMQPFEVMSLQTRKSAGTARTKVASRLRSCLRWAVLCLAGLRQRPSAGPEAAARGRPQPGRRGTCTSRVSDPAEGATRMGRQAQALTVWCCVQGDSHRPGRRCSPQSARQGARQVCELASACEGWQPPAAGAQAGPARLRRAKNAAMGKRTKAVPEAVSQRLGQATLLYATEKCVLDVSCGRPRPGHTFGYVAPAALGLTWDDTSSPPVPPPARRDTAAGCTRLAPPGHPQAPDACRPGRQVPRGGREAVGGGQDGAQHAGRLQHAGCASRGHGPAAQGHQPVHDRRPPHPQGGPLAGASLPLASLLPAASEHAGCAGGCQCLSGRLWPADWAAAGRTSCYGAGWQPCPRSRSRPCCGRPSTALPRCRPACGMPRCPPFLQRSSG